MKDRIVVVSTCRDAGENARKCILSVAKQTEPCHHIFIDDGSLVPVSTYPVRDSHTSLGRNTLDLRRYERSEGRCGLQNVWEAVSGLEPSAIVCWVDGDDWLAHPEALSVVRQAYENPDVWMTWGQFVWGPTGEMGWASDFPPAIRMLNNYRSDIWRSTHLKTFRAGLFQQIRKEDLMHLDIVRSGPAIGSKWNRYAIDLAVMFPMLEMSRYNSKFIELPLYVYSGENGESHGPGTVGWAEAQRIRAMPKYELLAERPW